MRIVKLFMRVLNWLKLNPVRIVKSKIRSISRQALLKYVGGYLATALAGTYITTSIFTPAHFLNPAQVISVAERTGIVNVLTCGLGAPWFHASEAVLGNAASMVGNNLNIKSLTNFGENAKDAAADYFERGLGTFTDGMTNLSFPWFNTGIGDGAGTEEQTTPTPETPINHDKSEVSDDSDVRAEALKPWDASTAPNGYKILDTKAEIDVSVSAGKIYYEGFDTLGRTGRATGNITYDMVQESSGWRAAFASDVDSKLAGWGHNAKIESHLPNGIVYHGYLYNRSHLIGDMLGGYDHVYNKDGSINQQASKSQAKNLITGTRFQNVGTNNVNGSGYGGMAYFENMVASYLKGHEHCSVWYSVEPVYASDDELIPRSCIVRIVSCDSDGNEGLNLVGIVYNVQPDFEINYTDGTYAHR